MASNRLKFEPVPGTMTKFNVSAPGDVYVGLVRLDVEGFSGKEQYGFVAADDNGHGQTNWIPVTYMKQIMEFCKRKSR
jgi:hypothetical protein